MDKNKPAATTIPLDKIDPIQATNFALIYDENGATLFFGSQVYTRKPDGKLAAEFVHRAAIAVPWKLAVGIYKGLEETLAKVGAGDPGAPVPDRDHANGAASKPN